MKKLLLFLFAILVSFTGFSQDLSQQANDCFDTGNYACAQKKYEASYLLAKTSQKQIIEIKIQTVKWCLNKLEIANNLKPDFIILNLGGGVQEILGLYLKKNLKKKTKIICTGAAISFFTKDQAPINQIFDRFFLGWLIRILFKPGVYLPRYLKAFKLFKLVIDEKIIVK